MKTNDIIIRTERENDYREVENLVRESFWNVYAPGCTEHFVLKRLRDCADFVPELDFVMEKLSVKTFSSKPTFCSTTAQNCR